MFKDSEVVFRCRRGLSSRPVISWFWNVNSDCKGGCHHISSCFQNQSACMEEFRKVTVPYPSCVTWGALLNQDDRTYLQSISDPLLQKNMLEMFRLFRLIEWSIDLHSFGDLWGEIKAATCFERVISSTKTAGQKIGGTGVVRISDWIQFHNSWDDFDPGFGWFWMVLAYPTLWISLSRRVDSWSPRMLLMLLDLKRAKGIIVVWLFQTLVRMDCAAETAGAPWIELRRPRDSWKVKTRQKKNGIGFS